MSKYVLVEIYERNMLHDEYNTIQEARRTMMNRFDRIVEEEGLDELDEYICGVQNDRMSAYANADCGSFDWYIIQVE